MSQGVLQVTEGGGTAVDAASEVEEETRDGDDLARTGPQILRNRRGRGRRRRRRRRDSGRGFRVAGILGRAEEVEVGVRLLQTRQGPLEAGVQKRALEAGVHKGALLLVGQGAGVRPHQLQTKLQEARAPCQRVRAGRPLKPLRQGLETLVVGAPLLEGRGVLQNSRLILEVGLSLRRGRARLIPGANLAPRRRRKTTPPIMMLWT